MQCDSEARNLGAAGNIRAKVGNYLWQLRPYSYADLLLLLFAVRASANEIALVSLMWFGFLIHLEWQHKDRGRLRWPWPAWVLTWAAAFLFLPSIYFLAVIFLGVLYSTKKRFVLVASISWIINGGVKAMLIAAIDGVSLSTILLVFVVTALRNLAGDIRDAGKDAREGVMTLPVCLGYRRNTPYAYPMALAGTSTLWAAFGSLHPVLLMLAFAVQAATYHRTPR